MTKKLGEHKIITNQIRWRLKWHLEERGVYLIIPTGERIAWHFEKLNVGNYIVVDKKYHTRLSIAHGVYSQHHPETRFAVRTIKELSFCKRIQ